MNRTLKKYLTALLSLVLILGMIISIGPVSVFAAKVTSERLGLKDYNLTLEILQTYMRDVRETKDDYLFIAGTACFLEDDFYYVALGDDTVAGESYAGMLAKEIGIKYDNLAKTGSSIEDVYDVINKNESKLADADLVTIGFGSTAFMVDAINQFLANKTTTYNWGNYVDKMTETALKEGLALMKDYYVEAGLDGSAIGVSNLPEALTSAIEACLYSCILYLYHLPGVIAKIHKINPDATIAVIGIYNPTRNITFDLGENMVLDMSDYLDRLTDIFAAYIINSCDLPENGIYIHAPEVSFKLTNTNLNMLGLLREFSTNKGANLVPNTNGHKYIKDQILKYISFTDSLLGDADGNEIIESVDAMLVLQYYAKIITEDKLDLSVCDVNKDKIINSVDAMLILQYYAKIIPGFNI